ncbi:MAG: hypothetical protein LBH60_04110, partial [Prevotellaceae bacterium]|nr:hypothetical protein [Prevotellaceae bacterium]
MKEENKNESAFDRLDKIIQETDKETSCILIWGEESSAKSVIRGGNGNLKKLIGNFFINIVLDNQIDLFDDAIKSAIKFLAEKYVESQK